MPLEAKRHVAQSVFPLRNGGNRTARAEATVSRGQREEFVHDWPTGSKQREHHVHGAAARRPGCKNGPINVGPRGLAGTFEVPFCTWAADLWPEPRWRVRVKWYRAI